MSEFPDRTTKFMHGQLSDSCLYQSAFTDATEVLEDYIRKNPDDTHMLAKLGLLYIDQWDEIKNPLRAVSCFRRVKELSPDYRSGCISIDLMLMYAKIQVLTP
jgi:hypothetical protein